MDYRRMVVLRHLLDRLGSTLEARRVYNRNGFGCCAFGSDCGCRFRLVVETCPITEKGYPLSRSPPQPCQKKIVMYFLQEMFLLMHPRK